MANGLEMTTRTALLWDGPNMQTTVHAEAPQGERIKFDFSAIGSWLEARATTEQFIDATIFLNVPSSKAAGLKGFVHAVRKLGYCVFAKPKDGNSDIDDDLVAHAASVEATDLVVATHDKMLIDRVIAARPDAVVTVVGIRELSAHAVHLQNVRFVDIEEIPRSVTAPIPRVANLEDLPSGGHGFPALRTLTGSRASLAPVLCQNSALRSA